MNLDQEIESLRKDPIVGGLVWVGVKRDFHTHIDKKLYRVTNYDFTARFNNEYSIKVGWTNSTQQFSVEFCRYSSNMWFEFLKSATLNDALIEALDIVKAKIMDLAKELGFVCFDKEQVELIYPLIQERCQYLDVCCGLFKLNNNLTEEMNGIWNNYQQLQKYIEEQ